MRDPSVDTRLCRAVTRSGAPCRNHAAPGSEYCRVHASREDEASFDEPADWDPFGEPDDDAADVEAHPEENTRALEEDDPTLEAEPDLAAEAARWPRGREFSSDQILEIMEAHREWRQSEGASGRRADLSYGNFIMMNAPRLWFPYGNLRGSRWMASGMRGAVLSNADLRGASLNDTDLRDASLAEADLRGAYLREARLAGAYLRDADLRGAFLEGAQLESEEKTPAEIQDELTEMQGWYLDDERDVPDDLEVDPRIKGANLTGARLRDADLSEARLTDVVGLRSDSLAGTVLTNAKLPPDIAKFELLEQVTEISRTASTTFLAMIAACAYCVLTIATTDVKGTGSVTLPIIDTDISVSGFFIVAPVVLVAIYVYLHMYLLRLWQGLGSLPARFPDGRSLDEKAYPWLLTSLVQLYVPKLHDDRVPLWWLQVAVSIATAWLLVPATVLAFAAVILTSDRWFAGVLLVLIAAGSGFIAWVTFRLARGHLSGSLAAHRPARPG